MCLTTFCFLFPPDMNSEHLANTLRPQDSRRQFWQMSMSQSDARRGVRSELARQIAVDFQADADFDEHWRSPTHPYLPNVKAIPYRRAALGRVPYGTYASSHRGTSLEEYK